MSWAKSFMEDSGGDAAVESAILFPIAVLIFSALVLVSMCLPAKASLQKSTQLAATAMASEKGDTWLFFDEGGMEYYFADHIGELEGIYSELANSAADAEDGAEKAEAIVKKTEESGYGPGIGDLSVGYAVADYTIYKEITVAAARSIKIPVDLSFIGFPKEITVSASSTAVTQNGSEFVRNTGLVLDFAAYIYEKYGISDLKAGIVESVDEIVSFMGWK